MFQCKNLEKNKIEDNLFNKILINRKRLSKREMLINNLSWSRYLEKDLIFNPSLN
jgi:hypothetical protein